MKTLVFLAVALADYCGAGDARSVRRLLERFQSDLFDTNAMARVTVCRSSAW